MLNLTDKQWREYERNGYLFLGQVATDEQLSAMQQEIDHLMLGKADVDYDHIYMQLDSTTGEYDDIGKAGFDFHGPTLAYRKLQGLEYDPIFLDYTQHTLFEQICRQTYGQGVPVSCFRAMFMNKPARQGTVLPWMMQRPPTVACRLFRALNMRLLIQSTHGDFS
jgi:hypothetical protein